MISTNFIILAAVFYCSASVVKEKPCGAFEARYPCGRFCETRCNSGQLPICQGMTCIGIDCRCKNGYARNTITDRCVEAKKCPPRRCSYGEILAPCGTICEGTCKNPSKPEVCTRILCDGPLSCRCDLEAGYVRNEKTGKCVIADNCIDG